MTIESTEEAYQALARELVTFASGRPWELLVGNYQILSSMCSSNWELRNDSETFFDGGESSIAETKQKTAALRFLRDDLLKRTGARIWGLTFTLYPDGKFNIDYDYDKPEGYEETDDVITGDEINASLNRLAGKE